jgi:hypothetical protein
MIKHLTPKTAEEISNIFKDLSIIDKFLYFSSSKLELSKIIEKLIINLSDEELYSIWYYAYDNLINERLFKEFQKRESTQSFLNKIVCTDWYSLHKHRL